MGFLKDLLIGGVAYKALKQSNPPTIVPPPTCTIVGMQHIGMGSKWRVTFIRKDNPNVKETSQFQRAQLGGPLVLIDGSSIGINSYLRNNQR